MLISARPRTWIGATQARFSVTSSGCRNQFFDQSEVDPDTSQSDAATPPAGDDAAASEEQAAFEAEFQAVVDTAVGTVTAAKDAEIQKLRADLDAANKKVAAQPSLAGKREALAKIAQLQGYGGAPAIRKGESTMSSRGYEMQRAVGFTAGAPTFGHENCKLELQMSDWLKQRMGDFGYSQAGSDMVRPTVLIPMSLDSLPPQLQTDFSQKFCNGRSDGLSALFSQSTRGADPTAVTQAMISEMRSSRATQDEIADVVQTLGTLTSASGGIFLDPAWNGEMIPLLIAMGAHYRLGVTPGTLPPNGMDRLQREDSIPTAYMVGEGAAITSSEGSSGHVDFKAKKMAALVKWNNELSRFGGAVAEARIRSGIARAMVVKEGELIHYGTAETSTSWAGVHSFVGRINYTSGSITQGGITIATNGNTFKPEAVAEIPAYLADNSLLNVEQERSAWFMRSQMLANIGNKRAAVYDGSATTNSGEFMFDMTRGDMTRGIPASLGGFRVVTSAECLKNRAKGSSSVLTSVVFGCWNYLHVRRVGVMELATSVQGDTNFANDQTWLRAIQHVDCKATRENAFLVADFIDQTA